ncbi:alanine--tRNA ligase [candidate division WWE3 bacterium]|nr:alanine--tRNA ligase [candidate division WWE3 bacterium]
MATLTTNDIRTRFLEYYKNRGHEVVPSSAIIPENDPTTLFTGSGMQPMLQYLLGAPYPSGSSRVVDSQKCFRAMDIEEVGDNRHTTFFEMLGNWSFGDYWKKEQLKWIFEFLTTELGLDPNKLYVTVFIGDEKNGLTKDDDSVAIWQELFKEKNIEAKAIEIGSEENGAKIGMSDGRIFYYEAKKNWWSRAGVPDAMPIGEPGGPDSEIFYDFGTTHDPKFGEKCHPNCDCGRFLEIANSVFMAFKKVGDGKFENLPKRNVDFGGGLERISAALNDNPDMFKIDIFAKIIAVIEEESGKKYMGENMAPMRVVADHLRGAAFMIKEGVIPANKLQGYALRRLIRRSVVKMYQLSGTTDSSELFIKIISEYIKFFKDLYFDELADTKKISTVLVDEVKKFGRSLDKGIKEIENINPKDISPKFAFDLYQTYGFPVEITQEILAEKGIKLDLAKVQDEKSKHQSASRTASAGEFKGGLGGTSEKDIWYHTLTHLLHKALRDVLGNHVHQAGSNITPERLRFDFTHTEALTSDEIEQVERIVNSKKDEALTVSFINMSLDDALASGALAFFTEKYGDVVTVYSIGDFSKEICGGPHVANTSKIKGVFKIVSEKSSGAGVRRIKAVVE